MPPCMGLGKSSPTNFLPPGKPHYTYATGKDIYGWPPSYESTCCENGFEDTFNNEWLPTDFVSDVGYDGGSQYSLGPMSYESAGYASGVGSSCDTSPLPSWSSIQNSPPPSRSSGGPTSPAASQQQLCRVCNDTATGNHFGVLSCEACKSFFRRSIRAAARYVCRGSKSCDIDKNTRNRCQHCRLQKCFDVGMNKSAVQEERMPYPTKRSKLSSERSASPPANQQSPTTPLMGTVSSTTGVPGMPFPFYALGPTPIHMMNSPFSTDTKNQKNMSTNMMLEILTKAERVDNEPRKVYHSPSSPLTFSKIQDNAKRSLVNVIAWAKELPMFSRLSVEDQLKLIKRSWNELLTLKLVYRNVVLQTGSGIAFQTGEVAQLYQSDDPMVISFFQKVTKECIASMQDIQLDQIEMSCLKFITLMNPFIHTLSANGQKDVENAQDVGLELLEAHIKQNKPNSPRRLCKLLLFLGQVKALSKDVVAHIEAQQTLGFESDSVLLELISDSD